MFADEQETGSLNKMSCSLLNELALQISHQLEFTNIFGELVDVRDISVWLLNFKVFPRALKTAAEKILNH